MPVTGKTNTEINYSTMPGESFEVCIEILTQNKSLVLLLISRGARLVRRPSDACRRLEQLA